jgi:hypothetical protein
MVYTPAATCGMAAFGQSRNKWSGPCSSASRDSSNDAIVHLDAGYLPNAVASAAGRLSNSLYYSERRPPCRLQAVIRRLRRDSDPELSESTAEPTGRIGNRTACGRQYHELRPTRGFGPVDRGNPLKRQG